MVVRWLAAVVVVVVVGCSGDDPEVGRDACEEAQEALNEAYGDAADPPVEEITRRLVEACT